MLCPKGHGAMRIIAFIEERFFPTLKNGILSGMY